MGLNKIYHRAVQACLVSLLMYYVIVLILAVCDDLGKKVVPSYIPQVLALAPLLPLFLVYRFLPLVKAVFLLFFYPRFTLKDYLVLKWMVPKGSPYSMFGHDLTALQGLSRLQAFIARQKILELLVIYSRGDHLRVSFKDLPKYINSKYRSWSMEWRLAVGK